MLLHLIRHGRPVVDPIAPPGEWKLDPAGDADLQALRAALPVSAVEGTWFSSDERKALATAERLTDSVVRSVPELQEAARSSYVEDPATFADAVTRGLQQPAVAALPGWEPLEVTQQRVTAAASAIVSRSSGNVVLVGHGTAWTLLISHLTAEPIPQQVPAMSMPDLLILDVSTQTVVTRWGEWRTKEELRARRARAPRTRRDHCARG